MSYMNVGSTRLKDAEVIEIDSGAIAPSQGFVIVQAETGTTDALTTINLTNFTMLTVNSTDYQPSVRITADTGDTITVTHGTGANEIQLSGDTNISLTDGEFIDLQYNGANWVGEASASGGGGAPTDATYIVQTADGTLTNEQALGALSTGVMYSTTTTGVVNTIKINSGQHAPCGRLTLSSSLSAPTSDITSATTLYYLPYNGDTVWLYNGTLWLPFTLGSSGINISIPATTDTNYDIFIYDNSGLTLEAVAWTNSTTRATAIVLQNGWWVKSGETNKLYLGSIRTTDSSGECEDSQLIRFVDNAYNLIPRKLKVVDTTDSWSYTTASTWRQARASTANQVAFVVGLPHKLVTAQCTASMNTAANNYLSVSIGLDSTSTPSADTYQVIGQGANNVLQTTAQGVFYPGIGYHYLVWLEYVLTTNAITIFGDAGGTTRQSGLTGVIWN